MTLSVHFGLSLPRASSACKPAAPACTGEPQLKSGLHADTFLKPGSPLFGKSSDVHQRVLERGAREDGTLVAKPEPLGERPSATTFDGKPISRLTRQIFGGPDPDDYEALRGRNPSSLARAERD